jgi:uncharacterized protein YjiS (DUF1127 family)
MAAELVTYSLRPAVYSLIRIWDVAGLPTHSRVGVEGVDRLNDYLLADIGLTRDDVRRKPGGNPYS